MDLDGDGHLDILSGCYSRHSNPMAGLFWLLRGDGKGGFLAPKALLGDDGEPLIIDGEKQESGKVRITDVICTRPFAVDLDADGKLDIVSGNFHGRFAFFRGLGEGKFAAKSSWLGGKGGHVFVGAHSDPFLVDFDGDGDLDMFSGDSSGGVWYFANEGTAQEPRFAKKRSILPQAQQPKSSGLVLGDAHIKSPQRSTRVWVDDVNGDGLLDVLIGDSVRLNFPAEGLSEDEVHKQQESWTQRQRELLQKMRNPELDRGSDEYKALQKQQRALYQERKSFVRSEGTGFVWLMLQKKPGK